MTLSKKLELHPSVTPLFPSFNELATRLKTHGADAGNNALMVEINSLHEQAKATLLQQILQQLTKATFSVYGVGDPEVPETRTFDFFLKSQSGNLGAITITINPSNHFLQPGIIISVNEKSFPRFMAKINAPINQENYQKLTALFATALA